MDIEYIKLVAIRKRVLFAKQHQATQGLSVGYFNSQHKFYRIVANKKQMAKQKLQVNQGMTNTKDLLNHLFLLCTAYTQRYFQLYCQRSDNKTFCRLCCSYCQIKPGLTKGLKIFCLSYPGSQNIILLIHLYKQRKEKMCYHYLFQHLIQKHNSQPHLQDNNQPINMDTINPYSWQRTK